MRVKQVTTKAELEEAFRLRTEVFVKEQGVALENEIDQNEDISDHVLVYVGQIPAGTGRVRVIDEPQKIAKLERICVLDAYRKLGAGKLIVNALEKIAKEKGMNQIKLHGQLYAEEFYRKSGYEKLPLGVFTEENIPHIAMMKNLG